MPDCTKVSLVVQLMRPLPNVVQKNYHPPAIKFRYRGGKHRAVGTSTTRSLSTASRHSRAQHRTESLRLCAFICHPLARAIERTAAQLGPPPCPPILEPMLFFAAKV